MTECEKRLPDDLREVLYMATLKYRKQELGARTRYKGTAFSTPAIGEVLPKGTKTKRNKDGTISLIPPEEV